MPRIRIAWKNGGAQHMSLVKKAAIAVIANSRVELEGGRERRQAAVVVAPITTAAEAPTQLAFVEPEVPVGPTVVRQILGPIRQKFKF